jgi:hypothetical protein
MIHPHTELRYVSAEVGYGVFATESIPQGTIVYAKDLLEIEIPHHSQLLDDDLYRELIEKYSYIEPGGNRVVSWDIAKYVNHSCDSNSLSSGYGFEVAIRDIAAGEQLTDDYGMFNIEHAMACCCGSAGCRGIIRAGDFASRVAVWDRRVRAALRRLDRVAQPLAGVVDSATMSELRRFLDDPRHYRSVVVLGAMQLPANVPARATRLPILDGPVPA